MSAPSFQGAEIYSLSDEMLGATTLSIVRDTSIKVTGVASWKLASNVSDYFETAKTKAATDVIAAGMFHYRISGTAVGLSYRICTAGDNGANAGRWYLGHATGVLKIYKSDGTIQASGSTLSASTWRHILLIDDGTTAYVYLDGNTTPDMTWNHGQGAWNAKSWGPSSIQVLGKAAATTCWFDDVVCFDDQDGRMDWITPSDWDGSTTWRVERAIPIGNVVTDFNTTGGANHYEEVDEDVDDTADYLDPATHSSPVDPIAREDGTDYQVSPATSWGWTHDLSPAGNEWTDAIWDAIATGRHHVPSGDKELLSLTEVASWSMGSEHVRAVRYMTLKDATFNVYIWRDTVLIGPDDPAAAGGRRRWHGGHF